MANGEEDLREKNKGWKKKPEKRYSRWSSSFGEEDAEMLLEKAGKRNGQKKKTKSRWLDEN